jgi:leucyl-tRNA synthetase
VEKYDHKKVEKKWQKKWEEDKPFQASDDSALEKYYLLVEFPYPSGNLHVGHWYAFSVPDIYARYLRMKGKNVLYPIGFDAFGLPAENAAIKRGLNPREWTYDNMAHMRDQIRSMGASFDWSREVVTCDPKYYKWTQWQFIELYKKGLVYRKETAVNWCPNDKTVLANEQVVGGHCERCNALVEQRLMPQWNIKITDYADRLIDDLATLNWPKQIKDSQINWIGRSEGAEIEFKLTNGTSLRVFTTRPDTLFGATYMVVAPEHSLAQASEDTDVQAYVEQAKRKTELERAENKEKTGVELKGVKAINPANGEEIPIFVADYVLGGYGTGAIMAVPAHDERDGEFAATFNIPVREVVKGGSGELPYTGSGTLVNSGKFDGMESEEAKKAITEFVGGKPTKQYHLRDWVVSRQRYWGVPIPMISCQKCGYNPAPEDQLPVVLPEVEDYLPTGDGKSPLAKVKEWVEVPCPSCGGAAERETDTLDTFVDSSWYFLRYTDPQNEQEFASKGNIAHWMPVDLYSGGSEHTTMHVLYSRFWHKALFDMGLVTTAEPYTRRMNRGLIMGPDGQKMSKSKGNVIDPDEVVGNLGADTVRMYLAFIGPYNEVGSYPWNPNGAVGVRRFLERAWNMQEKVKDAPMTPETQTLLQQTIQKVGSDIESLKMNTAVSALMVLMNHLNDLSEVPKDAYATFLALLSPFAPHVGSELAERMGVVLDAWPAYDASKVALKSAPVVVQINGKVRATLLLPPGMPEAEALAAARVDATVGKWLQNKPEIKAVYVPGKVINFVVGT